MSADRGYDDIRDLRDDLAGRISRGFEQVNTRLDVLNGRVRKNEVAIGVLQDRDRLTWLAIGTILGAALAQAATYLGGGG